MLRRQRLRRLPPDIQLEVEALLLSDLEEKGRFRLRRSTPVDRAAMSATPTFPDFFGCAVSSAVLEPTNRASLRCLETALQRQLVKVRSWRSTKPLRRALSA